MEAKTILLQCAKCTYSCKSKSGLYKHIDAFHREVRIPCKKCDYEATQSSHLMQHYKTIHEGVRFFCEQCPFKATRTGYVKQHVKSVHEGVKYPCDKCSFKARTRNSLRDHRKAIHEGVVFTCFKCPYKTAKKHNLKRHLETKHGTKQKLKAELELVQKYVENTKTERRKEKRETHVRIEKTTTAVTGPNPCIDFKLGKGKQQIRKNEKQLKIEIGSRIEFKRKKVKNHSKKQHVNSLPEGKIEVGSSIEVKPKKISQLFHIA